MNRDMPGARVVLELIEHPETRMVRQAHVQHDGVRQEFLRERQRLARASGDQAFEFHLAGEILEDSRETLVVFDDEEDAPAGPSAARGRPRPGRVAADVVERAQARAAASAGADVTATGARSRLLRRGCTFAGL